jgi:penicillin V acylase-like amidase (Ntn superfamily)
MTLKRCLAPFLLAALVLAGSLPPADACTTFCLRKGATAVFGKNYDWHFDDGLVLVNKRGVAKTATPPTDGPPARWTSRYGSVTFNQFGREFPSGGLNEAGLALELMWLDETRYPARDARPVLGALEWIQYQLDNYGTVAEMVKNAGGLRIDSEGLIHFLACDKGGSCATVEFLDGKPVVHAGASLPAAALANHTYENSRSFLDARRGDEQALAGKGSLQRFARAATRAEAFSARGDGDPVGYAFATLDDVAQGAFTQWSIVYDLGAGRVHWRTRRNRAVRSVALADFDLSCSAPVKVLDIQEGEGKVAGRFADYTAEANRKLIASTYRKVQTAVKVRPGEIESALLQPERTTCGLGAPRR